VSDFRFALIQHSEQFAIPVPISLHLSFARCHKGFGMQPEFPLEQIQREIRIRPLIWNQTVPKFGEVSQTLAPARSIQVASITSEKIGRSGVGQMIETTQGESILLVDSEDLAKKSKASHVLVREPDGTARWHRHPAFSREIESAHEYQKQERQRILESWVESLRLRPVGLRPEGGLRNPQLGAIHAAMAHWTLSSSPATVVMPTGTGKTETAIALMIASQPKCLLFVVPSDALRKQTADKFVSLGFLPDAHLLGDNTAFPVVGLMKHQPKSSEDLDVFDCCNVVIATMQALATAVVSGKAAMIADKCSHLFVDEAHHIEARTWKALKSLFVDRRKPVLQFTATPYRTDGQQVDGQLIYNYPLKKAQEEGYFAHIKVCRICEFNRDKADQVMASVAIQRLREDMMNKMDHRLLARCGSIPMADRLVTIYRQLAPELTCEVFHSKAPQIDEKIRKLRAGSITIAVCVDMFGEGFDLPQFKVAALHKPRKSLGAMMQLVGRLTRTTTGVGDASFVINIAEEEANKALENLYSEDGDWDALLSDFSFTAIKGQKELHDFLRGFKSMAGVSDESLRKTQLIASSLLPRMSMVAYRASAFTPYAITDVLEKLGTVLSDPWLNEKEATLFFVMERLDRVRWVRGKHLRQRFLDLFVACYDAAQELLCIHSSSNEGLHLELADALSNGTAKLINGDRVFRSLCGIARFTLQNMGLRAHGPKRIRYSNLMGRMLETVKHIPGGSQSSKAVVFGNGYRDGKAVSVGCSDKGRIWSHSAGSLQDFKQWSANIGQLLLDESLVTENIIDQAMTPELAKELSSGMPLCIDWPEDFLFCNEDGIGFIATDGEWRLCDCTLALETGPINRQRFQFSLIAPHATYAFSMNFEGAHGFEFQQATGQPTIEVVRGTRRTSLAAFFNESPPVVIYVDGSMLQGCLIYRPKGGAHAGYPATRLMPSDWAALGVNIRVESRWSGAEERMESIQSRVLADAAGEGYELVFDDDDAGEVADVVAMRETDSAIQVTLIHIKYSSEDFPGGRREDVQEVCAQAAKSARWMTGTFDRLIGHLRNREAMLSSRRIQRGSRFFKGSMSLLKHLLRASRLKPVNYHARIVQPGLSHKAYSSAQEAIIAAVSLYLQETANVDLDVYCSH